MLCETYSYLKFIKENKTNYWQAFKGIYPKMLHCADSIVKITRYTVLSNIIDSHNTQLFSTSIVLHVKKRKHQEQMAWKMYVVNDPP